VTTGKPRTTTMAEGRRADSARRRQRALKALDDAVNQGDEITVSSIARRAGIDRSFLYRHHDLLDQIHASAAQPPNPPGNAPGVTRASLQAELLNSQQRVARLAGRVHQLEQRLSETLGDQAWHDSGLSAPDETHQLKQQIANLEQHSIDLRLQLEERDQDLDAARAANRDLITRLNTPRHPTT
jgi:hypothetical protein